ncbi:hypothetical protein AMAG_07926 [Allomyces macrogynus ATCC 38327]|uniref:Amino acid transporter transmembrane domain-containing protein n=1 Tax=Allomyces macrogynus (strain ATCC 38327) TaxID=578462 RepID=A0A0L0SK01_ALLM3|nr:hypothetical protein AMAG_07926 [Allomyces macrogynus ATCC 38327]|eukprot:KNE62740.1 hypothetical protein AMAG_07926 [Allomyces macrogynus ATCC 38327]
MPASDRLPSSPQLRTDCSTRLAGPHRQHDDDQMASQLAALPPSPISPPSECTVAVALPAADHDSSDTDTLEISNSPPPPIHIDDDPGPPASFTSALLNLANVALGVGTLALPRALAHVGWVAGAAMMAAMAILCAAGLLALVAAADATGARGYTDLARKVLGRASSIVNATFFVLVLGTLAAYFTVIHDYTADLLSAFVLPHSPLLIKTFVLAITAAIIFPLSTFRSIAHLAFASSLSLACLVFAMALVPISFWSDDAPPRPSAEVVPVVWSVRAWGTAWGMVAMAFLNHSNVIEIVREMRPRAAAVDKIEDAAAVEASAVPVAIVPPKTPIVEDIASSLASGATLVVVAAPVWSETMDSTSSSASETTPLLPHGATTYHAIPADFSPPPPRPARPALLIWTSSAFIALSSLTVAITGYWHYGAHVAANILSSEPSTNVFLAARAGILACMVLSFPMLVFPCRSAVPAGRHAAAAAIIAAAYAVHAAVPQLDRIVALTGAVAGSLVVYVFPGWMYLVLARRKQVPRSRALTVGAWVNLAVGVVLLGMGLVAAVVPRPE